MLRNLWLSFKFLFSYSIFTAIFYLIVDFSMIYNADNMILKIMAITCISLFAFYESIKLTFLKLKSFDNIRFLLLLTLIEIELLTYVFLSYKQIDYITIWYSQIFAVIEFLAAYIYLSKKYHL